ncbi:RHS repeat-associated core domain-containing protein [Pseudomonas sp. NPDC089422]|uniref:RHS repeat-associated core domain-containing protein n=1 Tax=Pseudomonas sp. NPDC089422 TaxID=3364466 RepID=UPI00380BE12F
MNEVSSGVSWQAYAPYGHRKTSTLQTGLLGFNGELYSTPMECYALGNGHRLYNPRLMRFTSTDALSPFNRGGLNCYAYCLNDPINSQDPSGKSRLKVTAIKILAVNRFKKPLKPRKAISSMWKTLDNLEPEKLQCEMWDAEELITTGKAHITLAKGIESLHRVPEHLKNKFILTRDNNFLIGSYRFEDGDLSHASIARLGQIALGGQSEIVSAGYIIRAGESFTLTNTSGHYQPSVEQLKPARDYLESLGANVRHG